MKLEDQVCSLELAKKLKSLGAKQESTFYWAETTGGLKLVFRTEEVAPLKAVCSWAYQVMGDIGSECSERSIISAAFTVAELINMLQEITESPIIIPIGVRVADWLAEEIIDEKSPKKD